MLNEYDPYYSDDEYYVPPPPRQKPIHKDIKIGKIGKPVFKSMFDGWSPNLNAIPDLPERLPRIDWSNLSINPNSNAITLLSKSLFEKELDYKQMKENMTQFNYELMSKNPERIKKHDEFYRDLRRNVLHPIRMQRISKMYNMEFHEYVDALMGCEWTE
jgi:hypothetical protein